MGRALGAARLLAEAGGDPVHEEAEDCGFLYYTRFFRGDAARRSARAAAHADHGSFSILTLPADNGTWSVTRLRLRARPAAQGGCATPARWTALVGACPLHAHWLDGEPLTGVMAMGGVVDRYRALAGNGAGPPGVVSVGDAWACTNPSLGRGMALGLAHAALLRRVVREHAGRPGALTARVRRRRPSAS